MYRLRIVAAGDQATCNDAAAKIRHLRIPSPVRVGLLHGDPHPGNFFPHRRRPVLDFGAVGHHPDGLPPVVGLYSRLPATRSTTEPRS